MVNSTPQFKEKTQWRPLAQFAEVKIQIGIIEHDGHEFAALGATVVRKDLTGYIKFKRGHFWLTTWAGGTMLDCRSEIVERFWNGGLAFDVPFCLVVGSSSVTPWATTECSSVAN